MSAIKAQGIHFWDYSKDAEMIEAGKDIPRYLINKIDVSDYFVAVVSHNSLNKNTGRFTRYEMEYALKKGYLDDGRFILVYIPDRKGKYSDIGIVFPQLKDIKHLDFSNDSVETYVGLQEEICHSINKVYIPEKLAHDRLPFQQLFNDEVYWFAHNNSSHVALTKIIGEFNEYFLQEDWDRAYFLISYFISSCQYKIPKYQITYPWIVKAVCEQTMGYDDEAEKSYTEVLMTDPKNPDALGGLGMVHLVRQDHKEAQENFLKAESNSKGLQVKVEHLNYLMAKVSAGDNLTGADMKFIDSLDENDFIGQDRITVLIHKAVAYFYNGDFIQARINFQCAGTDNLVYPKDLIYYHLTLMSLGEPAEAEKVMKRRIDGLKTDDQILNQREIILQLAIFYCESNRISKCERLFTKYLMNPGVRNREIMIRYAQIMAMMQNKEQARQTCKEMMEGDDIGLAKTKADLYFDGFAQYILENHERARYDYEKSGAWAEFYDQVLQLG